MNRIQKIVTCFPAYQIDALLLTGTVNRQWATGFASSAGALVITKEESVFITDSRYIEVAKARIEGARVMEIGVGKSYVDMIDGILRQHGVQSLGFEEETMTQGAYAAYQKKIDAKLVPASELVDALRWVKSPEEVAYIQKAQDITDQTFAQVLRLITPEMTERELAAEIVYHLLKNGSERNAFNPIVVSGPRSSMPHGVPGDHKLTGFVTIDFGAVYEGYCADMTRTIAVGPVTDEMRRVYDTVLEAQLAGIAAARGGVIGRAVDRAARDVIEAAGYGACFGHGFGHSLGLEIHESLRAAPQEGRVLPVGAVISAEPGIYLPGQFGVRIEDLIYLTEDGSENLTGTTKELIVL